MSWPSNGLHVPADRLELLRGVLALGHLRHRVEGDVVGIVDQDQVIELVVPGERDGFQRDAFLQAAVAREADDVVVEDGVLARVELRGRHLLRNGDADRSWPRPARAGRWWPRRPPFQTTPDARACASRTGGNSSPLRWSSSGSRRGAASRRGTSSRGPRERTKRSRFSHFGSSGLCRRAWPKSTAPISAQPSGRPRWPELQAWTASMARPRASLAARERASSWRVIKEIGRAA